MGGGFVHEVGIGLVVFIVGVRGAPGFLTGMVGGGEECLEHWHWTRPCPGVNGERDKDHVFLVDFADDLITVDERCCGGGGLVHTSKFAAFMVLKIVVRVGSDCVENVFSVR